MKTARHSMYGTTGWTSTRCTLTYRKPSIRYVPHKRLVAKVEAYQLSHQLARWIAAYLQNRVQQVSVIVLGSVLAPVLFLAYINDLPNNVENSIRLFADDTKLYLAVSSEDKDCQSLQRDIDRLDEWSLKWQLKFHPKKCKTMHIGSRHQHHTLYDENWRWTNH